MKTIYAVLALIVMATVSQAAEVQDAENRLKKERYETRVNNAKRLLMRKEKIEQELEEIKSKLKTLDSGQDVEVIIPVDCSAWTTSISTNSVNVLR